MNAVLFYLTLPFIYLISRLPFTILYLLSDLLKFIMFGVFRYRKQVIESNLRNSFPERSETELGDIHKKFAEFFCDLMVETIKTLTISSFQVKKLMSMKNPELFREYLDRGQSVIIVTGHFGNWEIGGTRFGLEKLHDLYTLYRPLSNKYFDRLVYHMRTRLGSHLYPMNDAYRGMVANKDKVTATAFIGDQSPPLKGAHWTTFLNQETAVFTGTEKIARKFNYPVIFVTVDRVRRGKYILSAELLCESPADTSEGEITEMHTRRLEQDIKRDPGIWLWSHRRWKRKRSQGRD